MHKDQIEQRNHPYWILAGDTRVESVAYYVLMPRLLAHAKGPRFSEKDWYYLQAQTDMPIHYLKLVVCIFARFLPICRTLIGCHASQPNVISKLQV